MVDGGCVVLAGGWEEEEGAPVGGGGGEGLGGRVGDGGWPSCGLPESGELSLWSREEGLWAWNAASSWVHSSSVRFLG